jgi:hypothetical protein
MGLLKELADGQEKEISEEQYWHFLEVLPPAAGKFTWGGERWDFGFAEGLDYLVGFRQDEGRYYARQTDILNPQECGVSIADQALGKADGRKRRLAAAHESLRRSMGGSPGR